MLGTLVFGSFIALGRNIRVTLEQPLSENYVFFHTVPVNEKIHLRRILSDDSDGKKDARFSFIFYDEDTLARERYLYRAGTEEIAGAMEELLRQANRIIRPNSADPSTNEDENTAATLSSSSSSLSLVSSQSE